MILLCNYSPRGQSDVSIHSQKWVNHVKSDVPGTLERIADYINEHFEDLPFTGFLGPERVLVPVPGHALHMQGALWVAKRICEVFVSKGLGSRCEPFIYRSIPVSRSSTAGRGNRPSALVQFNSLEIKRESRDLFVPGSVTLVDDVLTKGNTILGATSKLKSVYPDVDVKAVAIFRTLGYVDEIDEFKCPVSGTISANGDEASRVP